MKTPIIIAIILLSFVFQSKAQTYNIVDGGTVSTCTGTLEIGTYTPNQTYTFTLCSGDLANTSHMIVNFTGYTPTPGTLCVYDGPTAASPLINCNGSGSGQSVSATAANTSGCLTFTFTAPSAGASMSGTISCQFKCQNSQVSLVSTVPAANAGYTDICFGAPVTFNATGIYQNTTYTQSDASSIFTWNFNDGTAVVAGVGLTSVTRSFSSRKGYDIDLKITDDKGCISTNDLGHRVRVSLIPGFPGAVLSPPAICPGYQVNLGASSSSGSSIITNPSWTNVPPTAVVGTVYLPDGNGVSYTSPITIGYFAPGQILEDVNDLNGICAVLEHSFMGDLTISITCPDNTTVQLEDQGGGGTYLGLPDEADTELPIGVGWEYCWTPNPTFGVMSIEGDATTETSLPEGNYASFESLSNLVGCPLNGQWIITVTDNWTYDNGYIFSWALNLNPALYPDVWGYTNTYTGHTWTASGSVGGAIWTNDGVGHGTGTYTTSATPTIETQQPFKLSVIDDFGCPSDTTINVTLYSVTSPNCPCNTPAIEFNVVPALCYNSPVTFTYNGLTDPVDITNSTFVWNFNGGTVVSGNVNGPGPIQVTFPTPGATYNVSLQVKESYCIESNISHTITIPTQMTSTIQQGTQIACYGETSSIDLEVTGGTPVYTYNWSNNTSIQDLTSVLAGTYNVTVADANGCTITNTLTINQPTLLTSTVTNINDVTCFGLANGSATANGVNGTPPYTYLWTGNVTTQTLTGVSFGTYNVTVTDNNGCISNNLAIIEQPTQLAASINEVKNATCFGLCNGTATVIASQATPPYTYFWSNAGGNQAIGTGLCVGSQTVTVTDANNCKITATTTITQPEQLIAKILDSENPTCWGFQNGSATLSVTGGVTNYTYVWSNGSANQNLYNAGADNYVVTVTDANLCTAVAFVNITQPSKVTLAISPNQIICIGQTAYITGTPSGGTAPYVYHWNNGNSTATQSVSPITTSFYNLSVSDANNCFSNSASSTIIVNPPLTISLYTNNDTICPGDPAKINAMYSGGNGGPYLIELEDGTIVNPPFTVYPTATTTYKVYVKDNCGTPTASKEITINVMPAPSVDFYSDAQAKCAPFTVSFTEVSPNEGQTYLWYFGDLNSSTASFAKNPVHTFNDAGVYDISLTVTSLNGCKKTKTILEMITVYPRPVANFYAIPEIVSIVEPVIYFENYSIGASVNYWSFGDGDSSNVTNPIHDYSTNLEIKTFDVQLIAVTDKGCKDTTVKQVRIVDQFTFYAPTAFSPDKDGINEFFYIKGNGIDSKSFYMAIYDGWGERVYETKTYAPEKPETWGWNGRIKGKEIAKNGSYYWIVIYKDMYEVEHKKSGSVTIIR